MTHPHPDFFARPESRKQITGIIDDKLSRAELTLNGSRYYPVTKLQEHSHAIANAHERHGDVEHTGIEHRRPFSIHTGRSTRENNPLRPHLLDTLKREIIRMNLAIDLRLAHPSRDQLCVLTAKVENENHKEPLAISS